MRTKSHVASMSWFYGEQDGVGEGEFKERIVWMLDGNAVVERGYLARFGYESSSSEVGALCLSAQHTQDALVREIGAVFASMFGRDQHLKIPFVDRDQEQGLSRVCSPFFESIA